MSKTKEKLIDMMNRVRHQPMSTYEKVRRRLRLVVEEGRRKGVVSGTLDDIEYLLDKTEER